MRLFIVGATGRTGRLLVEQALARGHEVTAFVRNTTSLEPQAAMKVVEGNALNGGELAVALKGQDVVVSVLGRRAKNDRSLLQDGATAMLQALRASHVQRYIVVSQGLLFPGRNPVIAVLRWALAGAIADSTAMERLVRASDIAWTIVRPPRLKEGGRARGYRVCVDARPKGAWSMERADLASFLLDEAEKSQYPRSIVGLG